jgi:hypothetical protein
VRRLPFLILLAAIVVACSACNTAPSAATVNGAQISELTFHNELNKFSQSSPVRCALGLLTGVTVPAQGAGTGTMPTKDADAVLSLMIDQVLYNQDLDRLKSAVDATYTSFARNSLAQYLTPASGSSSPCGVSGASLVAELPAWYVNQEVGFIASQARLTAVLGHIDLGAAGVDSFYQANPTDFQELCLDALATPTQSEAKADRTKIEHGASFESVAESSSINSSLQQAGFSPDGSYPCEPTTAIGSDEPNWASALEDVGLKAGVPTPAFFDSSQGGDEGGTNDWLVIELVKKEQVPLDAQVVSGIQDYLVSQHESALATEQTRLLKTASVSVDPEFGNWQSPKAGELPGVFPPSTPKAEDLLNPSADLGTS